MSPVLLVSVCQRMFLSFFFESFCSLPLIFSLFFDYQKLSPKCHQMVVIEYFSCNLILDIFYSGLPVIFLEVIQNQLIHYFLCIPADCCHWVLSIWANFRYFLPWLYNISRYVDSVNVLSDSQELLLISKNPERLFSIS